MPFCTLWLWVGQTALKNGIYPVTTAQIFHPKKISTESVGSVEALCAALDITASDLIQAISLPVSEQYKKKTVPKKDGSDRTVYNPHYLIRRIQRRINNRIFSDPNIVAWPDHIFGSIPNSESDDGHYVSKDYVSCARRHCGAKTILSLDIKDFFDNIHRDHIVHIFKNFFAYPEEVSAALASICCRENNVVQGALTSSYLATLCLFEKEGDLVRSLQYKGLTYTRFVDDITISSKVNHYDLDYATKLIEQMLSDAGLPLNNNKKKIQHASSTPLIVHGLRVDFEQPRLPPEETKRIRSAVHHLELLAATPGYRASRAYRRDFNRCLGRVNKLARVNHNQHPILLKRLRKVLPLPSHMDIDRAKQLIKKLRSDSSKPGYQSSYWFYKRYYVASERLGILKRSFPKIAAELRHELRKILPQYDDT